MAQRFYLIDGYNLLHAAGLAREQYGPGDFERARHRLLRTLAMRLDADERARTTIVFDAAYNDDRDSERLQVFELVTVIYSLPGIDADTEIEQRIGRHSSPKQLIVVSDDRRLQNAAKRRRATPVSSEIFYRELIEREPLAPEATMKKSSGTDLPPNQPTDAIVVAQPAHETPRHVGNVTDKDWDTHIDQLEADLKSRRHRHD